MKKLFCLYALMASLSAPLVALADQAPGTSKTIPVRTVSTLVKAENAAAVPLYEVFNKKGSYYDITYIELLAGSPAVQNAVNSDISSALSVEGDGPCDKAEGSEYEATMDKISVVPGVFFSARAQDGGYCAGTAHPWSEESGFTYDLSTGQKVALETQMADGTTKALDALLMKAALAQASPDDNSGGCTAAKYQEMGTPVAGFSLSPYELTIWTGYAHAIQACDVEITVSLADIKAALAPNSLLAKLVAQKK